ncbi:MAG TPA: hypothetical protein VEL74_02970 [Thermoanaerobaculia bacterium]|nr:hypothetical protein [Thermoanaerobaculia bacterium]
MSTGGGHEDGGGLPGMWDELAALLTGEQGLKTARLLQAAGLLGRTPETPEPADRASATPPPRQAGGGQGRRICLIGESAAAGFFYAPFFTPALALGQFLAPFGTFEVIDLARSGMSLDEVVETTAEALLEGPDLLVVFAGNNWLGLGPRPDQYADESLDSFQEYADAVESRGTGGLRLLADERMRQRARSAVDRLGRLIAGTGIPLVFVVPAANLADFENLHPVPWLPGDGVARWYRLQGDVLAALEQGDTAAATSGARAMMELDGGHCATSHRLLAAALLEAGETAEAHRALAAHLDTSCWDERLGRGSSAPAPVREALREGCGEHGFACVDLTSALAELTGRPISDRRLFLDHCHHTAEGIRLAMAAVAAEVLRRFGTPGAPDARKLAAAPVPGLPPVLVALAKLHAALYNAHMNRPVAGRHAPLTQRLLDEALDAAPGVREAILDYMAAMSAPGRAFLTAACAHNGASQFPLQHLAWLPSDLGIDALEPMAMALRRRGVLSTPAAEELARLLLQHHPPGRRVDISAPRYRERDPGATDTYALRQQPPTIFKALWPTSTFYLVADGERDLLLELTVRLPAMAGSSGVVAVEIDGERVGEVPASATWSRALLPVDRGALNRGLNRVSLTWPLPGAVGDQALATAVERLRGGLPADIYPVFGEVFSLYAGPRT